MSLDAAKNRLLALLVAAIGSMIAVTGLCIAFVAALQPMTGLVVAVLLLALVGFLIAAFAGFVAMHRDKKLEQELDDLRDYAAEEIASLPVEVVRNIVTERPVTAVALAAAMGFGLGQKPEESMKLASQLREFLDA